MSDEWDNWLADEHWLCKDCGVHTGIIGEYYMVHKHLWVKHGEPGMLCVGCLEERMGRTLSPDDFTDYPINGDGVFHSERLTDRLGKTARTK